MKKQILGLCFALLFAGTPLAFGQMSDSQIITYITEGVSMGKSENQIGNELLAKGVSVNQIKRLVNQYKNDSKLSSEIKLQKTKKIANSAVKGNAQKEYLPQEESPEAASGKKQAELLNRRYASPMDSVTRMKEIFGHSMFYNPNLSFEPNENAATPDSYILGPGDELQIDIFGLNEASINVGITPEGIISIPQIGPIPINGLTIKQATAKIQKYLSKIYSSINGPETGISVTLSRIRTIQVNILGEVNVPGTYRLSAFTTLFNALYRAKGVTNVGSLRNVRVIRGGKELAKADIYTYIFNGTSSINLSLKEGDVIIVPPYDAIVKISGGVKRPMSYEMKKGETLSKLLSYAGGFTGDANMETLLVTRKEGVMNKAYTVCKDSLDYFKLRDCDEVSIGRNDVSVFSNIVEIKGAVYRPGRFELGGNIMTVGQLVASAGGCMDNAFLGQAQLISENPDHSLVMKNVPLKGILDGSASDILLKKNDVLLIAYSNEIRQIGDLTISGFVKNPGTYEYAEHTTVNDLVMMAGGFVSGASTARVEVSRRRIETGSVESSDTIAVVYTFSISDGMIDKSDGEFELQPYDVVAIRKSPTYVEQQIVSLTGEITYPGQYTLTSGNERISDLIARAGGPTVRGSLRGGMLRRQISQYERTMRQNLSTLVNQKSGKDSIDTKKLKINEVYSVGVEIDKAVEHPGSKYDLFLRDGDEIVIPQTPNTVRIEGEVLFPNTVQFVPGKNVAYYVNQAGGFGNRAKRSKVYILNMNGTVSLGLASRVEPGCEIIVPSKPERREMTTGEWMSIGSTSASIATMVATIVNLIRR